MLRCPVSRPSLLALTVLVFNMSVPGLSADRTMPLLDGWAAGIGPLDKIGVTRQGSFRSLRKGAAPNQFQLDVRKTGDSFTITYIIETTAGRTALRRLSEDVVLNKRYTGAYVLPSGQNVYIRTGNYGYGKVLTYLEEETGRTGILFQETANSYTAGPSWALPDPIGLKVRFDGNPRL